MSNFKTKRDQAAEASVTRYNHKDPWVQYEMRRCGQLSFVEGADWAYVEASEVHRGVCVALINSCESNVQYLGEIERLKDKVAVLEYRPPSERMKERDRAQELESLVREQIKAGPGDMISGAWIERARKLLGEK